MLAILTTSIQHGSLDPSQSNDTRKRNKAKCGYYFSLKVEESFRELNLLLCRSLPGEGAKWQELKGVSE